MPPKKKGSPEKKKTAKGCVYTGEELTPKGSGKCANEYYIGEIHEGKDKVLYKVTESTNKVHRWRKLTPKEVKDLSPASPKKKTVKKKNTLPSPKKTSPTKQKMSTPTKRKASSSPIKKTTSPKKVAFETTTKRKTSPAKKAKINFEDKEGDTLYLTFQAASQIGDKEVDYGDISFYKPAQQKRIQEIIDDHKGRWDYGHYGQEGDVIRFAVKNSDFPVKSRTTKAIENYFDKWATKFNSTKTDKNLLNPVKKGKHLVLELEKIETE